MWNPRQCLWGGRAATSVRARPGRAADAVLGWVAERFKAAVLKTANPQGFVGSNPTPSATSEQNCERRA